MRIGFIGAGKVGCSLGRYICEHGGKVSGYYSRSQESAKFASEFTNTQVFESLETLVKNSDAIFLTVPDGAIREVWSSLRQYSLADKCICHCSGAVSSSIFSDIDQVGAFGYSIHPLFAIASRSQSYRDLSQAFFTIEGSERYLEYWKEMFESFGNPVKIMNPQAKVKYHCAAATASNLVVGLFEMAAGMLTECGFNREEARNALMPLFINNCMNMKEQGPVAALTGPVERADFGTVRAHWNVLCEKQRQVYGGLTEQLIEVAKEKHPERDYTQEWRER